MRWNWRRCLTVGAATLGLSACSAERTTAPGAESQVIVRAQALASTAGLVVDVTGPGIDPAMLFNIPVGANNVATDTLSVPAGGARRFVVTAIDTLGFASHRGEATVNLVAGVHTALPITLLPLSSSVGITITFGGAR